MKSSERKAPGGDDPVSGNPGIASEIQGDPEISATGIVTGKETNEGWKLVSNRKKNHDNKGKKQVIDLKMRTHAGKVNTLLHAGKTTSRANYRSIAGPKFGLGKHGLGVSGFGPANQITVKDTHFNFSAVKPDKVVTGGRIMNLGLLDKEKKKTSANKGKKKRPRVEESSPSPTATTATECVQQVPTTPCKMLHDAINTNGEERVGELHDEGQEALV